MRSLIYFLFFFLPFSQMGYSQSCANNLISANKEYEAGHINEAVELIRPCINGGFTEKQFFEAVHLMSLCYLKLGVTDSAKKYAAEMLNMKPNYKRLSHNDPDNFKELLNDFTLLPKWEVGVLGGTNINIVHPINNYSTTGSEAFFLPGVSYQSGPFFEYHRNSKISFILGTFYEELSYSRQADNVYGWKQLYHEKLTYVSLPVSVRYHFYNIKNFLLSAELGFQPSFFSKQEGSIIMSNPNGEIRKEDIYKTSERNNALAFFGGLNLKHSLGRGTLGLNMDYSFGMGYVNDPDSRFLNQDFIIRNQYVDSDIKFNTIYISFTWQIPISFTVKDKIIK